MPRLRNCPKCEADISGTYQEAEPDVGIMCGGWYCETCDIIVEEEDDDAGDHLVDLRRSVYFDGH